jgi:hypothetical protein
MREASRPAIAARRMIARRREPAGFELCLAMEKKYRAVAGLLI